jgi:hypothetical protein
MRLSPPVRSRYHHCHGSAARLGSVFVVVLLGCTLRPLPVRAASSPPPYSLPWQLRSAIPATVLRSDSALALYQDDAGRRGTTFVTTFSAALRVTPSFAPFVRVAAVTHHPPGATSTATSFLNPVVGGTYGLRLPGSLRLALFLGLALPVGQGGGDTPNTAQAAANKAGILARSSLDNALFTVDYFGFVPGADLAYVAHRWTIQVEVTFIQLVRARGAAAQVDTARTNFTTGLHVGYFILPQLSIGAELRYQRWLTTPSFVAADRTGAQRDTFTVAGGLRGHVRLGRKVFFRPGLAYVRGLDDPLAARRYSILQLDLPVVF